MKRGYAPSLCPPVPHVKVRDLSPLPKDISLEDAWQICGPTALQNMRSRGLDRVWQVIAIAYLEGLHHGSAIAAESPRRDILKVK